jgi:hypothetical protein
MFIPRQPVLENQFCKFGSTSTTTGIGAALCEAGAVLYLDEDADNQAAVVKKFTTFAADADKTPFGFSEQRVKTGYHSILPTGSTLPGDLGSSDVIAQPTYDANGDIDGSALAPVGVAHLGIWDTTFYVCKHTGNAVAAGDQMKPGQSLYVSANNNGKVTNHATTASDDSLNYERISTSVVAKVVAGASAGQCSANIANTTLYPIRMKLVI